jgi:serine/threonine protein kinase
MLTKLGKYTIKAELGHGAMGVVYLAEDPRIHRLVALKTMSSNVAGDPDLLRRFYREAESAGKLQHPNIVIIYEIDEAEGIPFIAMEFLEGVPLERIILERKELSAFVKLDLILQTCRALHYAHKHGIVHRDIKPANIMVRDDMMVKIVDFGIARIGEASMTKTGLVLGTPMYMSPEQIRGKQVDARADIFSVGVILYELLTYTAPFAGDSVPAVIYRVMNETPPPVSKLVQNCPPALDAIVARAIAKERGDRYQTAEDLAFDLERQSDFLKHHMLEVYVDEGQRLMGEGKLTFARESLQKALQIDSHHDMARSMLSRVQEELETRQRQEKIDQGMSRAQQSLDAGSYDEALDLLEEVLRLDPGHAQALEDRKFALAQRERQQLLAKHLEQAEELATAGDLAGTKTESEKLLALDPENKRASQLLDWAKKGLAEQERLAQVQQYIESAQACLSGKAYAGALGLLEKAHALDPINIEIASLLRSAREGLEREQRRELLNQRLGEIQDAISAEDFDRALQLADECLQEFPNNPQVVKLRAQAARQGELQRQRRYIEQQLQAATELFQNNDFPAAIAILEKTLETVPGEARLVAYLKTVRDAQEAAVRESLRREATLQANELIRDGDFAGAIRVLQSALQRAGHSPELDDLLEYAREQQAEWRRRDWQIRQVLARALSYSREENFEEAVRLLEQSQKETPSKEIAEALATAQAQLREYEQRREEIIQQALQWLQQGDPAKAASLMDAAPKSFSKNARFSQTYAQCQEALERLNTINRTTEEVERNLVEENWGEAEQLLRTALATYPGDPTLLSARRKLQKARAAARRSHLVKQLEEAQAAFGRTQYREVTELLSSPAWQASEFPDLAQQATTLAEEARQRQQEFEQRREETLQQALQWLQQGDPAKAVSLLDAAPRAYFEDARFSQTYAQCQEALDKLAAIQQTIEQVEKNLAEENWGEAEELLRAALDTYPGDPTLLSAKQKLQQAQADARRSRMVKQLEEAQAAFGRAQYREVGELLSSPDWQAGDFPDLAQQATTLAEEARQRQQEFEQRRQETLQQALQWLQQGDPAKAVRLLDAAPRAYFEDAPFSQTYAQCQEALDKLTAIQQTTEQVEKNLAEENWGEAEKLLRAALDTYPGDPTLLSAKQKLQQAQAEARRSRLVRQLEEAQVALGRTQYREARELLSSADWQAGDFPDLAKQAAALIEEARQKEEEAARRSRLLKQLEEARLAFSRMQYRAVAELLSSRKWQAGDFPDLAKEAAALVEEARQKEQEVGRRNRLVKQLEEARLAFSRKQYRKVEELLSSPNWQAGGFPDLAMQAAALAEQARQKEQEGARRSLLIKQLEEARLALGRKRYSEVRELLSSPDWQAGDFPDLAKQAAALIEEARQKEEEAGRRSRMAKQLEEARLAMGRKQYPEVRELLSSPDWQAGDFPDLAKQAAALIEEARKREEEIAGRQTIIQAEPPIPPPPAAGGEFTSLAESQKRLQEALQASPPPREKGAPRPVAPGMAVAPPPPPPAAAGPAPPHLPPVSPAPKPVTGKPAVVVPVAPAPVARGPKVLPEPTKRTPVALWVGIGVVVLALAVVGIWRLVHRAPVVPGTDGYAQVTAVPWAEITSVKTKDGQVLHVKGQTPLELKLPPGDYIIQLKNDQASGEIEVSVKSGEVVPVVYKFNQVNVDAWVDELVSK